MMTIKSPNSLVMRKQSICIYKDTIYIIMCYVKVTMIIKSVYWSAWQQLRDTITANQWGKKTVI